MPEQERPSQFEYSAVLTGLRNPRGGKMCDYGKAAKLYDLGADLNDLVTLFGDITRREPDTERFFTNDTIYFLENGYSTKDLLEVSKLKDQDDNPILDNSTEFWDFAKMHGNIEDAKALVQIRDSEGLTVFRNDDSEGGLRGFSAITSVLKGGVTAQAVQELVDIKNDRGISAFRTPRDIERFLENGGDLDYAKALLNLYDHRNQQIFDEFSIALFKECSGEIDFAQKLVSIQDSEGQTVFSSGEDVVNFSQRGNASHTITVAKDIVGFTDKDGKTIFRDGADIVIALGVTHDNIDKIQQYLLVTDVNGNTCFNGEEIALLLYHEVPLEYARKLALKGLNGHTIMYYHSMGFSEDKVDFANSGKPKALILYPTNDDKYISFQAFRDEGTFAMLRTFATEYDVKIRAISSTTEMYKELDEAEDTTLLILGGHGSPTSIQFGKKNSKYRKLATGDSVSLTSLDSDVKEHLGRMTKLKYVLLDSCLTGKGEEKAENMVNFIADCAPGVLVTGPTEIINARPIKEIQLYPLEVRLQAMYTHKDCTYSRRVEK